MKIGVSSYSLKRAIDAGTMTWADAIRWVASQGGEHFEVVPMGIHLHQDEPLLNDLVKTAKESGIDLSSYTIGANFLVDTEEAFAAEITRVKKEVDVAAALGVRFMRHDAGTRPREEATIEQFDKDLPRLIEACRSIADYAQKYAITTSVENHGYHVQGSERVLRLVQGVDRKNFRTTLDIGNFTFADEDPVVAVHNSIAWTSMVHFKDFYRRPSTLHAGNGWALSRSGQFQQRAAIVGYGDIDIPRIADMVKASGFRDYVSLEFEGAEDCQQGVILGLDNLRHYLRG